jgi:hypothetical protein
MTVDNWLKNEPERENLQSSAIGVAAHPTLDDLGRFLRHEPLWHHSLRTSRNARSLREKM